LRASALWSQCSTTADSARESVDDKPRFHHRETDVAQRAHARPMPLLSEHAPDRHRALSKSLAIDSSHDERLLRMMYHFCFHLIDKIDR
jgi:hypothetical protein